MAGVDATGAFNSAQFREAIQAAMLMGQPGSPSQQVTFIWLEQDFFDPGGYSIDDSMIYGVGSAGTGDSVETPLDQLQDAVQSLDNNPYSWTQTVTTITQAAKSLIVVNCAVQYANGGLEGEAMGEFDSSHVTLTLLDVDYTQTIGASRVTLGGYTYLIDAPGAIPSGLFDVTVWQYNCSALA